MKKLDLGQTITIFANIGVIAGIVFLAVEVRQNQATLERGNAMNLVAVQNSAQDRFSEFRKFLLENDELFIIWRNGMRDTELSEIEQERFDELCAEHVFGLATTHRIYDALGRAREAQNAVTIARNNIAESSNYEACWNRLRRIAERTGYFEFIEGVDSG